MKYFCRYFFVFFFASAAAWAQLISPAINPVPSREFGQPKLLPSGQLVSVAPNLVEGRELSHPTSIAFDNSVSPPIMYVVDHFNNRVLAWKNPNSLNPCGTSNPPGCGFADLVIGQRGGDKTATLFGGPSAGSGALSAGLTQPSAVAVDGSGNVYVADSGNNRIVRFPAPFSQTGSLLTVDLVIGQQSVSSGSQQNQGSSTPTAQTLALSVRDIDHVGPVGIAFDSFGNLWVPDIGNNRVLRFPAGSLAANTVLPQADVVLGQMDFVSNALQTTPPGTSAQLNPQSLAGPSSVAFDQTGNLYVSDALLRVLYYYAAGAPITTNGLKAARVLGANQVPAAGKTATPYPNSYTLGNPNLPAPPFGIATLNNHLYVVDSYENRIVVYDTPANWPATTTTTPSPQIMSVIGQLDLLSGKPNGLGQGKVEPDATVFGIPLNLAFNGNDLWVADSVNNRVMGFPPPYTTARRLVGQLDFPFFAINLIEGREVNFVGGGSLAVDLNSTPPHLYVADTGNNRILGFNDVRKVQPGSKADIVIGQTDFFRALINSPSNSGLTPTATGLNSPAGLVVDANGDLFVADSHNGRVLRFPAPFNQSPGATQKANLVLGQSSFTAQVFDVSDQEMHFPFGLALLSNGTLAVSDAIDNRVLMFKRASGQDFTQFQHASIVLGQPDFNSTAAGSDLASMSNPLGIASDTSDRLYVCDTSNTRVLIFTSSTQVSSAQAFLPIPLPANSAPQGVAVNQTTGEFWVAMPGIQRLFRFPEFTTLFNDPTLINDQLFSLNPLAVTLDASSNLIVAEGTNRVTFYYAAMFFRNVANYNTQGLAPGMLAAAVQLGTNFNFCSSQTCASEQGEPWPTKLSDLELTANGIPAPLLRVDSGAIYFQVPNNVCGGPSCPSAGVYFELTHPSTGAVVASATSGTSGTFNMVTSNPGLFTAAATGIGQVSARNDDLVTANSTQAPVARGKFISLYLTGYGYVPNAPADGVSPSGAISNSSFGTIVFMNGLAIQSDTVCSESPTGKCLLYSGLGGFPGGWVINVYIPDVTDPTKPVNVVVAQTGPGGGGISNILGQSNANGSPANDCKMLSTNCPTTPGVVGITTISVK